MKSKNLFNSRIQLQNDINGHHQNGIKPSNHQGKLLEKYPFPFENNFHRPLKIGSFIIEPNGIFAYLKVPQGVMKAFFSSSFLCNKILLYIEYSSRSDIQEEPTTLCRILSGLINVLKKTFTFTIMSIISPPFHLHFTTMSLHSAHFHHHLGYPCVF